MHNLLKYARDNSTLEVKFKRQNVSLKDPKTATYPLLYMTGHHEFAWSAEEVAMLQRYLKAGGLLLADACCGRMAFELAFRREIAKVLPGQQLEQAAGPTIRLPLPLRHPRGGVHAAGPRGLRAARARRSWRGSRIDGRLAVIYSRSTWATAGSSSPTPTATA